MRKKLIIGVVLLVVFVVIFGVLPMSVGKRSVPSNAITLLDVERENVRTASILLTNTTRKAITVEFVSMQIGPGEW